VKFFTVTIDRDLRIEAKGDAGAVELAGKLIAAVDRVIEEHGGDCHFAVSGCQRGTRGKILLEEHRGEEE
jgi:hypothetical protein